jgi:hypothetical protein
MRTCSWLLATAVALGGALALYSAPAPNAADPDRIEKLIKQLGSDQFAEREQATRDLEAIGAAAVPALEKAAGSADAETSSRAKGLLEKLGQAAESEKLLRPTRIRLEYRDTPVTEAVADLAKKTGFQIQLVGDTSKLAGRTITLDTGETTFWQAFDQFCQKAGLVEGENAVVRPGRPRPLPIQIQPLPAPVPGGALPVVPPKKQGAGQGFQFQVQAQPAPAQPAPAQPAPAQPKPVQVQGQPIQVQVVPLPAPVNPGPGFRGKGVANPILLSDGKPQNLPTCYAGSVRIRALPPGNEVGGLQDGEVPVLLEVTAEPRLQLLSLTSVRIDKAIDDQGQSLLQQAADAQDNALPGNVVINGNVAARIAFVARPPAGGAAQKTGVRLKKGDKPSRTLKELSGSITAQVQSAPEPLLTVENVLKAAGQTVKGQKSGFIKVIDATEDAAKSQVRLRVQFQAPNNLAQGAAPIGAGQVVQVQVQVQGAAQVQLQAVPRFLGFGGDFALIDAQGKEMPLIGMATDGRAAGNNVQIEHVLTFQARKGQADGAKLVYRASRTINLGVTFTLKDVPLP